MYFSVASWSGRRLLSLHVLSVVQGQRAQRIEMLLLHEFHARKFLLPDKLSARERERQARRQHAAAHADDGEAFEEVKAGTS